METCTAGTLRGFKSLAAEECGVLWSSGEASARPTGCRLHWALAGRSGYRE